MDPMNYASPAPQPAPQPVYAKGCISAAWADIKETPGYVGKLVILGLIMCVPILNFAVAGYLLRWSREVPFGGRTPMPGSYVTGKNFEFGFYAFVISLVVGLVAGVAGMVVGWIPFLGWLAYLVLTLAGGVAALIMQMRMIMGGTIGDGFNVKDVWNVAKRNWGQLLLVTLVPSIVVGAIIAVLAFIVVFFAVLAGLGGAMPSIMAASNASTVSASDVLALLAIIAVPTILATVVVYVLGCIAEVVAQALTVRGLGHWVARYAPEWTALAPAAFPAYPTDPGNPPASPQAPGAPLA